MSERLIVDLGFDKLELDVDLAQASAPIHYLGEEGQLVSTPFQTADARHRERDAAKLVIGWLGSDYWLNPDDDEPKDEIEKDQYIGRLIRSIKRREVEEES